MEQLNFEKKEKDIVEFQIEGITYKRDKKKFLSKYQIHLLTTSANKLLKNIEESKDIEQDYIDFMENAKMCVNFLLEDNPFDDIFINRCEGDIDRLSEVITFIQSV